MNGTAHLVNSWNEWDPLREIVVGVADNACFEPREPGHRPQPRGKDGGAFPTGPKPPEMIDRANEQLAGLVSLLRSHGVTVRRPEAPRLAEPVRTPSFEVPHQYCVVCPRDVMITVGHEIVEAPMSRRARYFEYQAYRKLVYEYWNADPRAVWTVAPKPSMADSIPDLAWVSPTSAGEGNAS
ncbi:hypothetical protein [Streptomyces katsurahamanus]|uniref:hypothetical protein n=1 Tax=Streptomyces katsurahamanus TaxID=2577098 RepID=UPI001E5AE89B|nr:hypothetical protein [Streptomyces katsurahamanus]